MRLLKPRWLVPIACGLLAIAFVALADTIVLPLHADGVAQPSTAWLDGVARVVELPGLWAAEGMGLRFRHHTTPAAWGVMLTLTGPIVGDINPE